MVSSPGAGAIGSYGELALRIRLEQVRVVLHQILEELLEVLGIEADQQGRYLFPPGIRENQRQCRCSCPLYEVQNPAVVKSQYLRQQIAALRHSSCQPDSLEVREWDRPTSEADSAPEALLVQHEAVVARQHIRVPEGRSEAYRPPNDGDGPPRRMAEYWRRHLVGRSNPEDGKSHEEGQNGTKKRPRPKVVRSQGP